MLAELAGRTRCKLGAAFLTAASFLPSSSNGTSAAQRDRAEATSSRTTTPRARTVSGFQPNKERQGPELPFERITIFRIPRELPDGYSGTAQYLGYVRDMFNEHPKAVSRRDILFTGRIRYAGPSPRGWEERQGRIMLEMSDPKTGRTGYGGFGMYQLCWDSLRIIQGQVREWQEWQEQAERQKEKMQNPFTRDEWTLGETAQEGVRFITTTVNGKWVRLQRGADSKDGWFKTDTLHPAEAGLIRDFYREQAKKTFEATGGLQLAVVMLPEVNEGLSDRLDRAALDGKPGDAPQPKTVKELLQGKLPDGVVVETTLVTDDLSRISSHLREVFDGSRQPNDQPLYPVTISDLRELDILEGHLEELLESLRLEKEEASLSTLELPSHQPDSWAHPGSIVAEE